MVESADRSRKFRLRLAPAWPRATRPGRRPPVELTRTLSTACVEAVYFPHPEATARAPGSISQPKVSPPTAHALPPQAQRTSISATVRLPSCCHLPLYLRLHLGLLPGTTTDLGRWHRHSMPMQAS